MKLQELLLSYGLEADKIAAINSAVDNTIVVKYTKPLELQIEELKKNNKTLTEENEKHLSSIQEQTESFKALEEKNKNLVDENEKLKPFSIEKEKATAIELLKGKVVEGSEIDVYNALKDKLNSQEDEPNIDKIVGEYLETKEYLKPKEVKVSDTKPVIKIGDNLDEEETTPLPEVEYLGYR